MLTIIVQTERSSGLLNEISRFGLAKVVKSVLNPCVYYVFACLKLPKNDGISVGK